MGENFEALIEKQKNKESAYFLQIQNCNEDIKNHLFPHIDLSKVYIPITITSKDKGSGSIDTVISIIGNAMNNLDGLLITNNRQTALNSEGKIILTYDGKSDLEYYFPFEFRKMRESIKHFTKRQIERRNENMKLLSEKNL
ncbi:hypothetical protein M9Y10_037275 [Tritrichomonas musculus]|uniref:Uncharacterized protein n=1 Tax=Tritrichomonas musculus TaxID=1915356 RepID=A0ABR2GS90_9EUKA